jgi:L-fuculose-phosphate aldolase
MDNHEFCVRAELIRVNRILTGKGLIRSSDGNISARLTPSSILITPSGVYKEGMVAEDLLLVDMDGKIKMAKAGLKPTSEILMHLEAYRQRPDIGAVLHAHPPYSTALTLAGRPFPVEYIPEVLIALGEVPTADYATPGTQAMADNIHELIRGHNSILLSHHGSLTVGKDLEEALIAIERMEHAAYTYWITQRFGEPVPLPPEELDKLRRIGDSLRVK